MKAAILILAAGRGTRMPEANKLTAPLDGEAVVRRVARAALDLRHRPVLVVTGHQAAALRRALDGLDVGFVHNPDYAEGLSTSLRSGIAALPETIGAVAVLLGDMPLVNAALIDRLVAIALDAGDDRIVLPVRDGQRGNPTVWTRGFFPAMASVTGDKGARDLLASYADRVIEVPVADDAAFADVDTREALGSLEIQAIAARADVDASDALERMRSEDS